MSEFAKKTKDELLKLLDEKRQALRAFKTNRLAGKVKNVKEGRSVRKDIARILTVLNAQ